MNGTAIRTTLRRLIRAQRTAFKGDRDMLQITAKTMREQFDNNKNASAEEVPRFLKEMDDAISFLEHNVVQAPLNSRGNYQVDANRIDESKAQ